MVPDRATVAALIEDCQADERVHLRARWDSQARENLRRGGEALVLRARAATALLVGAGPSLDDALVWLRHVRSALIIATDAAVPPLVHAGVAADLVVSIDPRPETAAHLAPAPAAWQAVLVADVGVAPATLAAWPGVVCLAHAHEWPAAPRYQILPTCATVLTTAWSLARQLGCSRIGFVGCDLAFTGGQPYARHTIWEAGWQAQVAAGATLEAIWRAECAQKPPWFVTLASGVRVQTTPAFLVTRQWLFDQASAAGPACEAANLTPAGLLQHPTLVPIRPPATWLRTV